MTFDHLIPKKSTTVVYTFQDLVGEPSLIVSTASEDNKPFFNAALRHHEQETSLKKKLSVEQLRSGRDRDRRLYADHVVMGWSIPPLDSKGFAISFSKQICFEFLTALPDDIFDGLRRFCSDVSNFRTVPNVQELSGNSPTG